jgi:hypothetical protein
MAISPPFVSAQLTEQPHLTDPSESLLLSNCRGRPAAGDGTHSS